MPWDLCHYSLVLRGGESGLGGTCTAFGNGFAGGRPRGGSGCGQAARGILRKVQVFITKGCLRDRAAEILTCLDGLARFNEYKVVTRSLRVRNRA